MQAYEVVEWAAKHLRVNLNETGPDFVPHLKKITRRDLGDRLYTSAEVDKIALNIKVVEADRQAKLEAEIKRLRGLLEVKHYSHRKEVLDAVKEHIEGGRVITGKYRTEGALQALALMGSYFKHEDRHR